MPFRAPTLRNITLAGLAACLFAAPASAQQAAAAAPEKLRGRNVPNVILAMADDLGWSDVAFNGTNKIVKTPHLDEMARSGIHFTRFHSAAPFCSPTRGSVLTGRHPYRYKQFGHVAFPAEELTIAEVLQQAGYATGHFGKWHMGGNVKATGRCNPGNSGFDEWFSTPNNSVRINPTEYHRNGEPVGVVEGEDNQILMDAALDFIGRQARAKQPFLAFVWFHTAHGPIDATPEFRALYPGLSEQAQKKWGDISAMDAQMGRLRQELRRLDVADNTLLCFCADNGMRGPDLRQGKHSLYEGGIRVAGLLEWPARVKRPFATGVPCSTVDYFPTILDAVGLELTGAPLPLDGLSLMPLIEGTMHSRPQPLMFWDARTNQALVDNRYKIFVDLKADRTELYDLIDDRKETNDLAAAKPELAMQMRERLRAWTAEVEASQAQKDYLAGPRGVKFRNVK